MSHMQLSKYEDITSVVRLLDWIWKVHVLNLNVILNQNCTGFRNFPWRFSLSKIDVLCDIFPIPCHHFLLESFPIQRTKIDYPPERKSKTFEGWMLLLLSLCNALLLTRSCAEQIGKNGNAPCLYSGDAWFESRPGHRLH
jgi:hypothetical protein